MLAKRVYNWNVAVIYSVFMTPVLIRFALKRKLVINAVETFCLPNLKVNPTLQLKCKAQESYYQLKFSLLINMNNFTVPNPLLREKSPIMGLSRLIQNKLTF